MSTRRNDEEFMKICREEAEAGETVVIGGSKPKGFDKFDGLMHKLVKVPPKAVKSNRGKRKKK